MKYRELLEKLQNLTDQQLELDVTVELGMSAKCFSSELRICGEEHFALDEDHPVIYAQYA